MDAAERLPPPVQVLNAEGTSPYVLLCEHASRFIPSAYEGLGLEAGELSRHIAWDIGAAEVATRLSATLDAPLVMAVRSVVDSKMFVLSNVPLPSSPSLSVVCQA